MQMEQSSRSFNNACITLISISRNFVLYPHSYHAEKYILWNFSLCQIYTYCKTCITSILRNTNFSRKRILNRTIFLHPFPTFLPNSFLHFNLPTTRNNQTRGEARLQEQRISNLTDAPLSEFSYIIYRFPTGNRSTSPGIRHIAARIH